MSNAGEKILVEKIAKALLSIRASKGMSQREVARKAGVSKTYYGNLERGIGNPTLELLTRIAENAFGMSVTELLAYGTTLSPADLRQLIETLRAIDRKLDDIARILRSPVQLSFQEPKDDTGE